MSDSLTFQRAKMVHFWFILSIVSGLAAPSFYPPPEHYIIDYQCFRNATSDILNNWHSLLTQQGVSSKVRSAPPLQIFLYGSGNHYVGQFVGEPHAETGEEG